MYEMIHAVGDGDGDSDGGDEKMGNFVPLAPPQLSKFPIDKTANATNEYENMDAAAAPIYSNYHNIYSVPPSLSQYQKAAYGGYKERREMDKIWEKLNYMTLLLEEQRLEATNHITEEFLLYMFLGIFMIFVVDGFSRSSGKYVR
jgi:hypothetical protein